MRKLKTSELNRVTVEEYKESDKKDIVVVLDNVRSSNNVGSFFRTSDALLVDKIYLCGITSTPPSRDIHKTALGAEDSVEWLYFEETIKAVDKLKSDGYKIFAIEQVDQSISLEQFSPNEYGPIALIFGNEVKGVSQKIVDICDGAIEIPQFGTKHSLNVSVSAGIVLWDIISKI